MRDRNVTYMYMNQRKIPDTVIKTSRSKYRTMGLPLPHAVYEQLRSLAYNNNTTMTAIIRPMIEAGLASLANKPAKATF